MTGGEGGEGCSIYFVVCLGHALSYTLKLLSTIALSRISPILREGAASSTWARHACFGDSKSITDEERCVPLFLPPSLDHYCRLGPEYLSHLEGVPSHASVLRLTQGQKR